MRVPVEGEAGSNSLEEGSHGEAEWGNWFSSSAEGKQELERESSFFDF